MDKIQELTTKLYNEGVEKGKNEADQIITQAKEEEQEIIDAAKKQAEELLDRARKDAEEMKSNAEAELKLFAAQASEALKTEITNIITGELATSNVKAATTDKAFMQQLITDLVKNWAKDESLTIGVENKKELTDYFTANAKALLDKGLKVEEVNGLKAGFELSPADGSYKVKFGEEEFVAYFREFLRPQIQKLLF